MKRFKIISFLLSGLLVLVGCDNNFETLNQDPNNPTAVPSSLLIPGIARGAQNRSYSTFVGGDMGACWAQQFSKVQYNDEERYIPRQSVITTVWDDFYAVVISDANSMYNIASEEENNNMMGVALTLQAYGYSFLTDVFGDIPFTEAIKAGVDGNISPVYDEQEVVYNGILKLLDDAIALLGTSGTIDSTNDIIYGGDATLWKKFASSLKFRVLMRASAKMDVASQLQALVSAGNLFTSNSEDARLVYLGADPSANPLYETIVFGTRGEWKVNSVMIDMLASTNDPRLAVYAQKNADGVYRGKPSGLNDVPSDDYNYTNVSALGTFYLRPELPGFFISYPELKFLMAEAVTKNYITGNANTHYLEGIRASMEYNGVSTADISSYLLNKSLATSSTQAALTDIATQNWIALYSQGVEAWTEWRRTKIPALTPAIDGALTQIPLRYNYPTTEASINKANYEAAVSSQGTDNLTTPLWWMD
ncbi:SusD/RagB family nutrient-binding outer membrane lipoprotein [Mariniflexile sp.]|uniref:SusD/RagB family nutrient-binding outer membrane lipoprotein n=1 Tax=Mariniflexile sp. TaxID=1979402 RepID=UPI00356778D0